MDSTRADDPDALVTGEAVALDLPMASLPLRMVASLIDVVLTVVALVAFSVLAALASLDLDTALAEALAIVLVAAALVAVPTTVETLTRGQSLGKRVMGLRVVRDDAGAISFQHAFVRALLGVVEIYALSGTPALLTAALHPRGKRLGDLAAGTYVVRDRVSWTPGPAPTMPPALAAWAAGCDLRPMRPELGLAIRRFLDRAPTLSPAAAAMLEQRLLADALTHVHPAPPPGAPGDAVLAALLAERRRRSAEQLARQDAARRRLTTRRT